MTISTGNFPKAMKGANMKPPKKGTKTMSAVMKQDKAADAKMSPAMMRKDIKSDRALLAQKVKKGGKK